MAVYFLPCAVAPYNVVIMGDNTYDIGDQLELNCSSEGGPDLEYSWSRTNSFLATTTTNTSTLTISDLATVDGGNYTCAVTNDAGTSNYTISVNGESFVLQQNPYTSTLYVIIFKCISLIDYSVSCIGIAFSKCSTGMYYSR